MSLIENRKARFELELRETLVAGVVLTGGEVKSLRAGHGSLAGAHVVVVNHRPQLLGAQISPYPYADNTDYDPKRTRLLLLKKNEVAKLETLITQQGWTALPLKFFIGGRNLKLEIGIGTGRKQHQKKALLKERDLKREAGRELKSRQR